MENQRIRLSKMMMKKALTQLLGEKSLDKITVYELCEQAQINRTTFYKYYGSPYDLLEDIERDLFDELERHLLAGDGSEFEKLMDVLAFLNQDRHKWKILINAIDDQDFTERLFGLPVIRELIRRHIPVSCSAHHEEYVRLFFCHGGYAIIRKWLNEEDPAPAQEIAGLILSAVERTAITAI